MTPTTARRRDERGRGRPTHIVPPRSLADLAVEPPRVVAGGGGRRSSSSESLRLGGGRLLRLRRRLLLGELDRLGFESSLGVALGLELGAALPRTSLLLTWEGVVSVELEGGEEEVRE